MGDECPTRLSNFYISLEVITSHGCSGYSITATHSIHPYHKHLLVGRIPWCFSFGSSSMPDTSPTTRMQSPLSALTVMLFYLAVRSLDIRTKCLLSHRLILDLCIVSLQIIAFGSPYWQQVEEVVGYGGFCEMCVKVHLAWVSLVRFVRNQSKQCRNS